MTFTLTAEQQQIIDAARESSDNLLISARAGAAKTTTIEQVAHALPDISILALAFNKKIADELTTRLPRNCEARTLNAIGHRAWRDFLGRSIKLDASKSYGLLKQALEELDPADKSGADDNFRDLLDAIRTAKSEGYLPTRPHSRVRPLIEDESFFSLLEFEPSAIERHLIDSVVVRSFELAMQGVIDFDDQILMPTIMPASFPRYELVMIDEAQDLSRINQLMLQKIVKRGRLIAVGDECQAIYGFRGASTDSMRELRSLFDMRELHLTICFRSAEAVVREAQWRAPDMRWRDGAPSGLVLRPAAWSVSDLQDGDAVLCRNNAPLFSFAVLLLKNRRLPELASGDITKGLLAVMQRLGPKSTPAPLALEALTEWHNAQKQRVKAKSRLADQVACIEVFLRETDTLGAAITFLRDITQRPGRIKLMTGHKSKGLEFDRVWILNEHLLKKEGQDLNLRYVMQTRARERLAYISFDNLEETPDAVA